MILMHQNMLHHHTTTPNYVPTVNIVLLGMVQHNWAVEHNVVAFPELYLLYAYWQES